MRKYVIMGVQGSGKGTQAKLLAEDLDLVHIGVGDIFRWNVEQHTKLGAQVRRTMAAGGLVSDELVEAVVQERLDRHDWNYGFVIDGFPRNERQAEFFLESYDIDGVIVARAARRGGAAAGPVPPPVQQLRARLQPHGLAAGGRGDLRRVRRPPCRTRRRHARGARRPAAATTTRRPVRSSSCSSARSSSPTSTPPTVGRRGAARDPRALRPADAELTGPRGMPPVLGFLSY